MFENAWKNRALPYAVELTVVFSKGHQLMSKLEDEF
jgi:hypothetical protein